MIEMSVSLTCAQEVALKKMYVSVDNGSSNNNSNNDKRAIQCGFSLVKPVLHDILPSSLPLALLLEKELQLSF